MVGVKDGTLYLMKYTEQGRTKLVRVCLIHEYDSKSSTTIFKFRDLDEDAIRYTYCPNRTDWDSYKRPIDKVTRII